MIQSFRHKGLERLFRDSDHRGVAPDLAKKLLRRMDALDTARAVEDLDIAGWGLHALKGDSLGQWSLKISGNWRLTFRFDAGDAFDVNLEDYH